MELEQVLRGSRLFGLLRRRHGRLVASGRPWHTGIAVRLRQARVGSPLAFARDGAQLLSGLLRRFWRARVVERTVWLRTLEIAWHASGAATQLADAALAGETIAQLATRIANIARELAGAEAVAVFGRSPAGPVVLGNAGADLGVATYQRVDLEGTSSSIAAGIFPSAWIVMARSTADIAALVSRPGWVPAQTDPSHPVWTDDFSNLFGVFKWEE